MSSLMQAQRERIGRQIRKARVDAKLSHDALGARVGTTRQHLIKLEKGQHAPRGPMLAKIAKATGKPESFFEGDDEESDSEPMSLARALHEIAVVQKLLANELTEMRRERSAA